MSGGTGGHNVAEWLRAREIVTVRCACCSWTRTGTANKVLPAQRTHVARCEERHALAAQRARLYRLRHPERVKASKERWRQENPHKEREAHARYRERNKERLAAYLREWRAQRKSAA